METALAFTPEFPNIWIGLKQSLGKIQIDFYDKDKLHQNDID